MASFLDNKKGLGGATLFIMAIFVIVVVIAFTAVFMIQTRGSERIIRTVSTESADDFVLSFLSSTHTINGIELTGEELIFLTAEGLDATHLENIITQRMNVVCKDGCYGEFSSAGLTFKVGKEKLPKKITSSINLPIKTEVNFYVKK